MRRLLVASQKGGVGKTTTSMNLAAAIALTGSRVLLLDADPLSSISSSLNLTQHAQRQALRESGLDLPGILVSNVIPGLDVLSPYEDAGCSDDDLDRLLAALAEPAFQDAYDFLLVDTPPFMGANPGQLLATCDQFILVMRAEPMAYRTLPAFLELVQRSRGRAMAMRGILLTLPEGETPGGRWERELRGRFGSRILPNAIPYDDSVSQAVLFGQIICHTNKNAPAAVAYHALVETLDLSGPVAALRVHHTAEQSPALAALRLASKTVRPRTPAIVSGTETLAPVVTVAHQALASRPAPSGVRRVVSVPPAEVVERPSTPRRRLTPITAIPVVGPAEIRARSRTVPVVSTPEPVRQIPARPQPPTQGNVSRVKVLLWVLLGVVVGIGLRFVEVPDSLIPYLVGTGVALMVALMMKPSQSQQSRDPQPAPTRKPASRRSDSRIDPGKRLSGLKRRIAPARNLGGD